MARNLADLAVTDVGVSFHASEAAKHDDLAGVQGSFAKALAAVRLLKENGVRTIMKHSSSSMNFGEYALLRDLAERENCLFECDSIVVPEAPGSISPYALSQEQHLQFMQDMGATPAFCSLEPPRESPLHCDAGRSLCGITPGGDVVPCVQLPLSLGNVRDRPFRQIWSGNPASEFREQETEIADHCISCPDNRLCSRCPGVAYLETGKWRGMSQSLCRRTRASVQLLQGRSL